MEIKPENLSVRLARVRNSRDLPPERLAEEAGVDADAYRSWETGEAEPSASELYSLAKYYAVSADYLAGLAEEEEYYWQVPSDLSPHEIEFLSLYRSLPTDLRERAFDTLRTFADSDDRARLSAARAKRVRQKARTKID